MSRSVKRYVPAPIEDLRKSVSVAFDRLVFSHMVDEIAKHATVEEGGKYIGYLIESDKLIISDFLPSGSRAVRTEVEFRPDGEYQERLFREIEKADPAIEHLGTWHTHHCNGLQELSRGDVEGYLRTVNKRQYRLNFFVASLVKRVPSSAHEVGWIDHFLFVRGMDMYFDITRHVSIIDSPTRFEDLTGHHADRDVAVRSAKPHPRRQEESKGVTWYDTEEGRHVLSEDRRFFSERFGKQVQATRSGGQIKLSGRERHMAISISYPESLEQKSLLMELKRDDVTVLKISCSIAERCLGFAAALAAAKEL